MARLLMRALGDCGHHVNLASTFRTYDGTGDADTQRRIKSDAEMQTVNILEDCYRGTVPWPDLWFTYHLYHKAPDWIGPVIAGALNIPYIVAEASVAPKQSGGPWDIGYQSVRQSLERADLVMGFNPVDAACTNAVLRPEQRYETLAPFIDIEPYDKARQERDGCRARAADRYGLALDQTWLMTSAMMRHGDKLASYRQLARALSSLRELPWQLIVAGDGEARHQVYDAFAEFAGRVIWFGQQDRKALPGLYAAADIYVWPAVNEAFGMAFLEAQSASLPVIAGDDGGVSGVVHAPDAGVLVPVGDTRSFANALRTLCDDPGARACLGAAAFQKMKQHHSLPTAARTIDRLIEEVRMSCS